MRQIVLNIIGFLMLVGTMLAFQCTTFDSNMGATFDLSDLSRSAAEPAYLVEDGDLPCTVKVEQNYTYLFNVCGAVASGIPDKCRNIDGIATAAALQINKRGTEDTGDDWCYVAGRYSDKSTTVKLLDGEDPTKGLKITYSGEYCASGNQRQFIIEMACADRLSPVPTHALEHATCVYTITMDSIYGCPQECPVSNRHLCGGNGHCAYDEDKRSARCFCNKGHTGADCSRSDSESSGSNYSPALMGLIITLFIIVCLLGGGLVFMVRQIQAYKDDMAHYEVLRGGDSEGDSSHGVIV